MSRASRYRSAAAATRVRQEAVFRSMHDARRPVRSIRGGRFIVVNDAGRPLCEPTNEEAANKLARDAGGRVVSK